MKNLTDDELLAAIDRAMQTVADRFKAQRALHAGAPDAAPNPAKAAKPSAWLGGETAGK